MASARILPTEDKGISGDMRRVRPLSKGGYEGVYKISERDVETVSSVCGVSDEIAIVALHFARGNIGVAVDFARNDVHLLSKNT